MLVKSLIRCDIIRFFFRFGFLPTLCPHPIARLAGHREVVSTCPLSERRQGTVQIAVG